MTKRYRAHITLACASGAYAFVAFSALALAQVRIGDVTCKKTETQAECFARLKCKANEELEDCQKRLMRCNAGESLDDCKKRVTAEPAQGGNAGQQDNANRTGGDRGGDQSGREREPDRDRGERDSGDRDRGERERADRDRGERERADRDRGDRDRDDGGRRRERGERRRGGGGRSSGFQANKTFGLGLELGEPTGLNGKYFVSDSGAIDFGVGYMYTPYYYGDGLHVYGDYLWHPVSLVSASAFEMPFYVGVGVRYWDFHYCYQGLCNYGGSAVGVRVPLGIAFDFNNAPLDIFLQVVPVLDFVNGDYYNRYRDRAHFDADLSAGLRFWFK